MITTAGIFKIHADADKAINELHAFGVPTSDLSYVYVNVDGEIVDDNAPSKTGSGLASGMTAGTVIGAVAGLVIANGILPGLGSLIVAGPLAAALGFTGVAATAVAGAATGAVAGGLIGALTNIGISDADANIYENFVRSGEVLIVARTESLSAKDIFITAGAQEVREYIK